MTDENEPSSESELKSIPESELSERKGTGGAIALAIGVVVAVGGGVLKNADGLWKPLLKHGDDLAKSARRHVDDIAIPKFPSHVDDIGGAGSVHADEAISEKKDSSLEFLWDAAGEGAKSFGDLKSEVAKQSPRGNNGPRGNAASSKTISYEVEVVSSDLTQSYRQRDDGAYHITETSCRQTMVTTQDGAKKSTEEEIDKVLPEESLGEYTRVELRRDGDVTLLREASRTLLGRYNLDFDSEVEVEFEEGDWTMYQAGNRVTVRYPAKSREIIMKAYQEQVATQIPHIASQSPDIEISAINVLEVPHSSFVFQGKELRRTTVGSDRILMKMLRRE